MRVQVPVHVHESLQVHAIHWLPGRGTVPPTVDLIYVNSKDVDTSLHFCQEVRDTTGALIAICTSADHDSRYVFFP